MKETVNVYGVLVIKHVKYPHGRKKEYLKSVLDREVVKF